MSSTKKKMTTFFVSFKNWFFLSFLAIIIISLSLFFFQESKVSKNLENLHYVEEMELLLSQWEGAVPSERLSIEEDLATKFVVLKDLSFSGETLARSLFAQGKYELFVLDNKGDALENFSKISLKSYQYPLALLYIGYIYEENADWDLALLSYEKLSSLKDDFFRAQGIFHQAILIEQKGELELAMALYSSLVEDFPNFMWGQLAQNRLVYLGLLQN